MPVYKYNAVTIDGTRRAGSLEAANESQLMLALKNNGLFLTNSRLAQSKAKYKKLKTDEVADFCRQLSAMLSSGITLIRAIQIIEARDAKPEVKRVYHDLINELRRGSTLSESMEKEEPAFPPLLTNMIRAGENSGGIDKAAEKMAVTYDKQHKLNAKMKSASIYPIVLVVLIVLVVIILFTFVLPSFLGVFGDMELPLPTQIMMGISNFMVTYWALALGGALALGALIVSIFRQPGPRKAWDKFKLKSPVFGKLLRTIYTARFARTLASLYVSGIPMIQSLRIGRSTVGNTYIEDQFDNVINSLGNGRTLSQSMAEVDGFDVKLQSTISVGEESGRLESMLDSVSDQFDYEAEMATQRLVSLMEPAMIIVMAFVVVAVIVSVLLPIFQMYQSIG
ncbi:MAG: type II secretion system F family protein [Coriobacteriia bacterium]|nr:type II secretion system F family protein [Coriobacteriia bacterium]MCL2749668.1 type II secretion system F family protein [Coriobacteriia bacterium]